MTRSLDRVCIYSCSTTDKYSAFATGGNDRQLAHGRPSKRIAQPHAGRQRATCLITQAEARTPSSKATHRLSSTTDMASISTMAPLLSSIRVPALPKPIFYPSLTLPRPYSGPSPQPSYNGGYGAPPPPQYGGGYGNGYQQPPPQGYSYAPPNGYQQEPGKLVVMTQTSVHRS